MTAAYLVEETRTHADRVVRRVAAVIAVLFVVGVVGLLSVDGKPSPVAVDATVISRASAVAQAAGTQRISLRMKVSGGGASASLDETGVVDPAQNVSTVHIEQRGALRRTYDLLASGATVYLAVPESRRTSTAGKAWISVDATAFKAQPAGGDLRDNLAILSAVGQKVERVGSETVHGVVTVKYHANLDLARMVERLPAAVRAQTAAQLQGVDTSKTRLRMDVWIDGTGLPRRIDEHLSLQGTKTEARIEITDYGKPVDVAIPSPSDTFPANSLQVALSIAGVPGP